ncbi:MAG: (deoxy)nucleoside triphosphate pyrophosphohydrolase [Erysipelotrichaceae bacterium]
MKTIEVVAALIMLDQSILIAKRQKGEFSGMWEFPGGKIELGESHETALRREIDEELNLPIMVDEFLATIEYDYPNFHLVMHCYFCTPLQKSFSNLEHSEVKFVPLTELKNQNWIPADVQVVSKILKSKGY